MLKQAGVFKIILTVTAFLFFWRPVIFAQVAPADSTAPIASEVEMQMRQAAEAGSEQSYLACSKILESAASTNRFALVAALDAGIEVSLKKSGDRRELVLPEELKKQLIQMWSVDGFHPALIRVLARSGSPAAFGRAGFMANEKAHPVQMRLEMINLLGESKREDVLPSLIKVIGPSHLGIVREAGLEALRNFESENAARGILRAYHLMTEGLRYRARDVLFSRKAWSLLFLEELDAKKIFTGEIPTEQLQKIAVFADVKMNSHITNRWGLIRNVPEKKQAEVQRLKKVLAEKSGDALKGKTIFEVNCAQCHPFFGDAEKIGPNLSGVSRHNTDFLLTSLIDPDAFVRKKHLVYHLEKIDGSHEEGVMVVQNSAYAVLLTLKGERSVMRDKINSLTQLDTSLMPDVLESLAPDDVRDLIAYLQSEKPTAKTIK